MHWATVYVAPFTRCTLLVLFGQVSVSSGCWECAGGWGLGPYLLCHVISFCTSPSGGTTPRKPLLLSLPVSFPPSPPLRLSRPLLPSVLLPATLVVTCYACSTGNSCVLCLRQFKGAVCWHLNCVNPAGWHKSCLPAKCDRLYRCCRVPHTCMT